MVLGDLVVFIVDKDFYFLVYIFIGVGKIFCLVGRFLYGGRFYCESYCVNEKVRYKICFKESFLFWGFDTKVILIFRLIVYTCVVFLFVYVI